MVPRGRQGFTASAISDSAFEWAADPDGGLTAALACVMSLACPGMAHLQVEARASFRYWPNRFTNRSALWWFGEAIAPLPCLTWPCPRAGPLLLQKLRVRCLLVVYAPRSGVTCAAALASASSVRKKGTCGSIEIRSTEHSASIAGAWRICRAYLMTLKRARSCSAPTGVSGVLHVYSVCMCMVSNPNPSVAWSGRGA